MHRQNVTSAFAALITLASAISPRLFSHNPIVHKTRANARSLNTSEMTCTPLYAFTTDSWLENLSLRPNGDILTTVATTPTLYLLPSTTNNNTASKLLYTFPNATTVSGVTSCPEFDTFYVAVGSFNFTSFSTMPGTYSIWKVVFEDQTLKDATITKVADLPHAAVINGITTIPNTSTLLLADSNAGLIYKFDPLTLAFSTLLDDPTLKPTNATAIQIGVNGLKFSNGYLYFSNSHLLLLARVPVSPAGSVVGPVETIHSGTTADDFIFSSDGRRIFVAEDEGNAVSMLDISRVVDASSGNGSSDWNSTVGYSRLVGGGNSTTIMGPTALAFGVGDEAGSLFYTSNGGIAQYGLGDMSLGGSLGRIDGIEA